MFFWRRFRRWLYKRRKERKEKLWCEFREWYQIHEQALSMHFLKCLFCQTPASSADANFCFHCGARFHTEPGHIVTDPGLYATEPILPSERPSETLRRKLQERRQTRSAQFQQQPPPQTIWEQPTPKFRTVRLDRIV